MSETASPPEAVTGLPLKGVVVVAHGGQEVSTKPTTAVQLRRAAHGPDRAGDRERALRR